MDTQDQRKPYKSGNEGHGGVHVCHKCGWPFPNPHPSSRHRKAHKRVCGTIEGYKLEDSTQENSHVDLPDDECKTPSGKVVETPMSEKSSSDAGSKHSRSIRSEDEVFADAVTEFVDSPGPGEVSDGIIDRQNSLQKMTENDPDGAKLSAGNAIDDNSSAPDIHVGLNNQPQTVQKLEGENEKVEGGMQSQDCNSSSTDNSTLFSASFTIKHEKAVEQHIIQSSITSSELNPGAKEGNETLSKDLSELITTSSEACGVMLEDVSDLRDISKECLDSVYAEEMVKPTGLQTDSFEGKVECSDEVDSPVNSHALLVSAQAVDKINGNTAKSTDVIEELHSKIDCNENMHVVAVPDTLPLQEHPDLAVKNLGHKGGKINVSMTPDATSAFMSIACSRDPAVGESGHGCDFAKSGESSGVNFPGDVSETVRSTGDMLKEDAGQNESLLQQNIVGEVNQISYAKVCDTDVGEFKDKEVPGDIKNEACKEEINTSEEQKDNTPSDNIYLEGAVVDGSDYQENKANAVNEEEHFVVRKVDCNQVQVEEFAGTSLILAESASIANEQIGGEDESKGLGGEIGPAYNGSDEVSVEPEIINDGDESSKILNSVNVMADHSQSESLPPSKGVNETQSTHDHIGGEECITKDDTSAVVKTDDTLDSPSKTTQSGTVQVLEGASFPSSIATGDNCAEKIVENASGDVEVYVNAKKHFISAVDAPGDSYSQADSLDGHWGSVSVLSAISDTSPATDTAASNTSQASGEAGIATVEPKVVEKGLQSLSKTLVEPQATGLEQKQGASEIKTSQIEQQQSSALQTGWSPSLTHMTNDQLAEKRDEEIIAKVTNWNTEKQHTPLKTLLGEATARSLAESPSHDVNSIPDLKDEVPVTKNEYSAKTENAVLGANETAKEEIGREWNSPARYPVNIKTEKRRAKNKPYWAPFLCCSSVHAAR